MMNFVSKFARCLFLLAFIGGTGRGATVGGTLTSNTVWTAAMKPVFVTSSVTVPSGLKLTIEAGTEIKMTNGVSIAATSATIDIEGTEAAPVLISPSGTAAWGPISATGNNSFLTIRHAELTGYANVSPSTAVSIGSQGTALIEDTYIHDVATAVIGNAVKMVTMRRMHVNRYSQAIFNSGSTILAEDSLFENMTAPSSDALEIQNGPPGSIIRRCTFRHSPGSNSDAVDCNGSTNVFVHDCLIYDFSDKGCSFGTATAFNQPAALGMVVSNCFIYGVDSCIAVKDKSTASIYNNTLVGSAYGIRLYQKYNPQTLNQGGHITNGFDNIIWGNSTNVLIATNSGMTITYSDLGTGDTNFPGAGNLNADPLFLDVAERDYRLGTNSPAVGAGRAGDNMGAHFPVGAPMALSHPRIESEAISNGFATISFWADSEKSYTLESSGLVSGGTWTTATNLPIRPLPVLVRFDTPVGTDARFFRLRTP